MKNRIGAYVSRFGWRFGVFHDRDTLAVYYKIFGVKRVIDRVATTRGAVAAARQKWGCRFYESRRY